jgi:hypothetical protein
MPSPQQLLDLADRYIAELDAIEGDSDFEPWLGFIEPQVYVLSGGAGPGRYSMMCGLDQRRIAWGSTDDREHEDEREPQEECVPSYADGGFNQTVLTGYGVA